MISSRFFLWLCLFFTGVHALEKIVAVHPGGKLETKAGAGVAFFGLVIPDSFPPAQAFLTRVLKGRSVQLSYEGEAERRDKAGALWAYVDLVCDTCAAAKITGQGNTMDFSAPLVPLQPQLLEQGLARVDTAVTFPKRGYFLYLQKKARKDSVGIWGR